MKKVVLGVLPARFHLPLRYGYEWLTGNLEPEMSWLGQLLVGGSVAVDIGANYGIYSYYLAKLGKSVEAFEPLPECASTIRAYRSPRIRVHNVALSSSSGTLQLYTPVVDGVACPAWSTFTPLTGTHTTCVVPVKTLDDYCFKDLCLLKIDVEGHELEVLKGAERTIRREQPLLMVEVEQRHLKVPMTTVFDYILSKGYSGVFCREGVLHPLSAFSFATHQEPFLDEVHNPAYVNNFLFVSQQHPLPELLYARQAG